MCVCVCVGCFLLLFVLFCFIWFGFFLSLFVVRDFVMLFNSCFAFVRVGGGGGGGGGFVLCVNKLVVLSPCRTR